MNSNWRAEVLAVLGKELKTELRTKSGLLASGLFSVVAVVGVAFATNQEKLSPQLAAALLWVVLLFSSVVALARSFVAEEEAGTANLLRLVARSHAVFWGKALFNLAQMLITAAVLTFLLFALITQSVGHLGLFALGLLGGCASMAGAVTLCGALVAQAANRSALVGAIGIPLLLPLIAMEVASTGYCLGGPGADRAVSSTVGLVVYAAAIFAVGPWLFDAVWKE